MSKLVILVTVFTLFALIAGETGVCSWYGTGLNGALTASGERFNENELTAAHKTLPFGTRVRASCNGRSVVVRINDRGPFTPGRILDLSTAAGNALNIINAGLCNCQVDRV